MRALIASVLLGAVVGCGAGSRTHAPAPASAATDSLPSPPVAESTTVFALTLLRSSYGDPADETVGARIRGASALRPPVESDDVEELVDETVAWLDHWLADPRNGPLESAVLSGRNAVLRVGSAAALSRLEAAVASRAPARVDHGCVADEDDAIRTAVLRYEFELAPEAARYAISVPGATCVQVQTLHGPLRIATTEALPAFRVGWPTPHASSASLPWPTEPAFVVGAAYEGGDLAGSGHSYVVQHVDGAWRVVARTSWVS